MPEDLYSLRMRAERAGRHMSGAERLLIFAELESAATAMLQRALQHPRGPVERISLQVDEVPVQSVHPGCLPDLHNNQVADWQQGRDLAGELLRAAGVSDQAVEKTLATLAAGGAPDGSSMRGAMLVDVATGERLEADRARGIRVSRMDLSSEARRQLRSALDVFGLDNAHVTEALTLAAKVISAPGVVAELCWSDDPDYQAGYVAAKQFGYQRISRLKPLGEERGGRAFFVNTSGADLTTLITWLESQPLLVERIGRIHPPRTWTGAS